MTTDEDRTRAVAYAQGLGTAWLLVNAWAVESRARFRLTRRLRADLLAAWQEALANAGVVDVPDAESWRAGWPRKDAT